MLCTLNHFILDDSIDESVKAHIDIHVISQAKEATQLLSTAKNILQNNSGPYKTTHVNHPIAVWVRESYQNYLWMCRYGLRLCEEYTHRYHKVHKCEKHVRDMLASPPKFTEEKITPFCKCMDEEYQRASVIDSYRTYYLEDKLKRLKNSWKGRQAPEWVLSAEQYEIWG